MTVQPDGVMVPYPDTWEWRRLPGMIDHWYRSCCGEDDNSKSHSIICAYYSMYQQFDSHMQASDVIKVMGAQPASGFGQIQTFVIKLICREHAASRQATRIVAENGVLAQAIEHFLKRNRGYGEGAHNLGIRGQYADLNRKMLKLKRYVWDDVPVEVDEEDVETIVKELIGHCLLMLDEIKEENRG